MSSGKILTGAVILGGAVIGGSYLLSMKRAGVHLEVVPKVYVHSVSLSGLKVRVDALLKNPTRASFSVKFPFIRLAFNNSVIGSSQAVDKDIEIPAFGQVVIDNIMVEMPALNILSTSYTLIKSLLENRPVVVKATVLTTINVGLSRIPFESSAEIQLKK